MARSLMFLVLPILLHHGVWVTQAGQEINVPCPDRAKYREAARTGEAFRLPRGCIIQDPVVAYNPEQWLTAMARTDALEAHDQVVSEHYDECSKELLDCTKDIASAADECVGLVESASSAIRCPTPRPCPAWGDRAIGAVTAGALCVGLSLTR